MSGQWLLFGRLARNGSRDIILYDLSTRDATKLDEVGGEDTFLAPGQVNGDYAVWYRCTPGTKCNVILYNITDGDQTKIPNPGAFQYAPSVGPDGTVTFARSAAGCGNRVRLMRDPLNGSTSVLWQVPSGGDVGTTRVFVGTQGKATIYFDNFACGQRAASDVWQILEGGATQLTVKVEGSGSVTSSPAGINCGSDCTETYDPGTGVTLTATPQGANHVRGVGRSVHREHHDLHAHDGRREIGHGDLHDETGAERGEGGNRRRDGDQLSRRDQLRHRLQRALRSGHQRHPDRGTNGDLDVRGVGRSVLRDGRMHGHDECVEVGDRDVHARARRSLTVTATGDGTVTS